MLYFTAWVKALPGEFDANARKNGAHWGPTSRLGSSFGRRS